MCVRGGWGRDTTRERSRHRHPAPSCQSATRPLAHSPSSCGGLCSRLRTLGEGGSSSDVGPPLPGVGRTGVPAGGGGGQQAAGKGRAGQVEGRPEANILPHTYAHRPPNPPDPAPSSRPLATPAHTPLNPMGRLPLAKRNSAAAQQGRRRRAPPARSPPLPLPPRLPSPQGRQTWQAGAGLAGPARPPGFPASPRSRAWPRHLVPP